MVGSHRKGIAQSRLGKSAAVVLRETLTEQGLKRFLTKHRVNPLLLQHKTPDEAARHLQRRASGRPSSVRYAKKSAHAPIGHVGRAHGTVASKASKKSAHAEPRTRADKSAPNYRVHVWNELHVLICTDNKRYAALRKMFTKESTVSQAALVSTITVAISAYIGAASAIIAPFVALGLMSFLQVSKNAGCGGRE